MGSWRWNTTSTNWSVLIIQLLFTEWACQTSHVWKWKMGFRLHEVGNQVILKTPRKLESVPACDARELDNFSRSCCSYRQRWIQAKSFRLQILCPKPHIMLPSQTLSFFVCLFVLVCLAWEIRPGPFAWRQPTSTHSGPGGRRDRDPGETPSDLLASLFPTTTKESPLGHFWSSDLPILKQATKSVLLLCCVSSNNIVKFFFNSKIWGAIWSTSQQCNN